MLSFLAIKEKKEQRKFLKEEYQFVKESDYFPFYPLSEGCVFRGF